MAVHYTDSCHKDRLVDINACTDRTFDVSYRCCDNVGSRAEGDTGIDCHSCGEPYIDVGFIHKYPGLTAHGVRIR